MFNKNNSSKVSKSSSLNINEENNENKSQESFTITSNKDYTHYGKLLKIAVNDFNKKDHQDLNVSSNCYNSLCSLENNINTERIKTSENGNCRNFLRQSSFEVKIVRLSSINSQDCDKSKFDVTSIPLSDVGLTEESSFPSFNTNHNENGTNNSAEFENFVHDFHDIEKQKSANFEQKNGDKIAQIKTMNSLQCKINTSNVFENMMLMGHKTVGKPNKSIYKHIQNKYKKSYSETNKKSRSVLSKTRDYQESLNTDRKTLNRKLLLSNKNQKHTNSIKQYFKVIKTSHQEEEKIIVSESGELDDCISKRNFDKYDFEDNSSDNSNKRFKNNIFNNKINSINRYAESLMLQNNSSSKLNEYENNFISNSTETSINNELECFDNIPLWKKYFSSSKNHGKQTATQNKNKESKLSNTVTTTQFSSTNETCVSFKNKNISDDKFSESKFTEKTTNNCNRNKSVLSFDSNEISQNIFVCSSPSNSFNFNSKYINTAFEKIEKSNENSESNNSVIPSRCDTELSTSNSFIHNIEEFDPISEMPQTTLKKNSHGNLSLTAAGNTILFYEQRLNEIMRITPLPEVETILQQGLNKIVNDKRLICNATESIPKPNDKITILNHIEKIFTKILTDIKEKKNGPLLKIRSFKWHNCKVIENRLKLNCQEYSDFHLVKYKNAGSQSNFSIIVYLLGKIYSLVKSNGYCTKREIYYQIVNFVKSQDAIDKAVNSISCLLNVPPWECGILASSTGLVYGDLQITMLSGEILNCFASGGTLIPQNPSQISSFETNASFILVVEKDSIYQKLLDEKFPTKLTKSFVLVTGKGYPDISTRLFLKILWMKSLKPIFILTDADPDGIDIMLTYKFGSLSSAHLSDYLAIPQMKWLGIHPSEIIPLDIKHQPLTQKDESKIKSLLNRPYFHGATNNKIYSEIEKLREKKVKAEIEGIMKTDNFLSNVYLPNKFFTQNYI